jgi:hypothetical protein
MTHLGIYSSKAQDASGPHRPDLNIPGLIMGWFLPADRPHSDNLPALNNYAGRVRKNIENLLTESADSLMTAY